MKSHEAFYMLNFRKVLSHRSPLCSDSCRVGMSATEKFTKL